MAMNKRRIYGITSKFNYVVDVILESIEKAHSTLEEFSECGVDEVERKVEIVQDLVAGCCVSILDKVDSGGNNLGDLGKFFGTDGMTEIKHDDDGKQQNQVERPDGVIVPNLPQSDKQEDLETEAEEEIEKLYEKENDALLEKFAKRKEEENSAVKVMKAMREQNERLKEEEMKQAKIEQEKVEVKEEIESKEVN